jgi:hypothetical protein
MFVQMKKIPAKAADTLDLIIEFATLGEYGLEYPEGHRPKVETACEGRRRSRPASAGPIGCQVAGNPEFASALRPPRIKLSFTE